MNIFRKMQKEVEDDPLAVQIANKILSIQKTVAVYLNEKTKHLTVKFRLFCLIFLCITMGGYCLYLLINAFN